MRIQESEYRIKKKNNTMDIMAPDSWLLTPVFSCFFVPAPGVVVSMNQINA